MTKELEMEKELRNTQQFQNNNEIKTKNAYENLNDAKSHEGSEGCFIEEDGYVTFDGRTISKEDDRTHYAQILTRAPCDDDRVVTERAVRKTRKSDNPILQHCHDNERSLEDSARQEAIAQDDFAFLHNDQISIQNDRSDSEIIYKNIDSHLLYENTSPENVYENTIDVSGHVYENCGRKMRREMSVKSTTSNETSETESLYEDLDIYETMNGASQRSVSKPIDISVVYTSVNFAGHPISESPLSDGSYSNTSSLASYESTERPSFRRCTSYCYGNNPFGMHDKPPELPQRCNSAFTKRSRPRSLYLGRENGFQTTDLGLGLFTGTLVGSYIVNKTSPKSIQKIIAGYLAREKKEYSKPVSFQVTSDFLSLSYNCAPWWLLARNSTDDIGCITTYNNNNKTALGYTVSKAGEDTRLFVIHCSDADQIKDAIVKNFKRPSGTRNSISRWGSLNVLNTSRSGKSRSLPRMSIMRSPLSGEIACYNEIIYLGNRRVKKSFLVVNDKIGSVLDHTNSNDYTVVNIQLYQDAIHLKNSRQDRIIDMHQLEWILSMGLFDEDRRYFGYISSKSFQGSKTRISCHVFRCSHVEIASQIMDTLRQACQATYLARTADYPPDFRSRTSSNASTSSEGSVSSNSETMSLGSATSSSPEVNWSQTLPARFNKRNGRYRVKPMNGRRMKTILSFAEEDHDTGIDTLGDESSCATDEIPRQQRSVVGDLPPVPANVSQQEGARRPEEMSSVIQRVEIPVPSEQILTTEKDTCVLRGYTRKLPGENCQSEKTSEKRFSVLYLVSTILSPPLKSKHVKECLKQYQKTVDKAMKKSADNVQHYRKAQLVFSPRGIMIFDEETETPQAFFQHTTISGVQSHPDGKCAFAFTTRVSGNTKNKCHLFLQDKDPIGAIIQEIRSCISP